MKSRILFTVAATVASWLAVSLLLVGGGHDGYWGNLWWRLQQARRLDEELIMFVCALLFSVAFAVHLVAIGFRTGYRQRFLYPQLGVVYAVVALVAGSILRQPLRQPWEIPFHVLFVLLAAAGFVGLFGRRYLRIMRHE